MKAKLLILFIVFLFSKGTSAQTLYGSQIDYRLIDSFKYEVRLLVFNDCTKSAFQLGTHGTLKIKSSFSSTGGSALNPTLTEIKDISNYHDTVASCSSGGSLFGVHQYTYIDTVDFNTTYISMKTASLIVFEFASNYMKVGNNVCYGSSLRPTVNYATLYLQSQVQVVRFANTPTMLKGINQPIFDNHHATPNNGDSVSYSFTCPLRTLSISVGYKVLGCSGFASCYPPFYVYFPGSLSYPYNNPNSNPPIGMHLDPFTADLIYTPVSPSGDDNYVIEAKIWKKDTSGVMQVAGVIRREAFNIHNSLPNNNPPIVNGPYSYHVCEGSTLTFNITTNDNVFIPPPPASPPPADSTTISWDSAYKHLGPTFTVINPNARLRTGQFSWTPQEGTASASPYVFSVQVNDNNGLVASTSKRSFRVLVKPRALGTTTFDTSYCGSRISGIGVHSVIDSAFHGTPSYRHQIHDTSNNIVFSNALYFKSTETFLSLRASDTLMGDTSGVFIVQTTINNTPLNCPTTYYDTITLNVENPIASTFQDTITNCSQATDTLFAPSGWSNIVWSTGDTSVNSIIVDSTGDYWVEVQDSCGFKYKDYTHVQFGFVSPPLSLNGDTICQGDSVGLILDSTYNSILWSNGVTNDSIVLIDSGSYSVVAVKNTCVYYDTFNLVYNPPPQSEIFVDSSRCDVLLYTSQITRGYNNNQYWKVGSVFYYTDSVSVFSNALVRFIATNSCGADTSSIYLTPVEQPVINIPEDTAVVCNSVPTVLSPSGNYQGNWLWSTSQTTNQITVAQSRWYYVTNFASCDTVTDSVFVILDTIPIAQLQNDTSICIGDTIVLQANEFPSSSSYNWSGPSGSYSGSATTTTSYAGLYILTQSNSCGSSKDSMVVDIIPTSQAEIMGDTTICEGDTITLVSKSIDSTYNYFWNSVKGDHYLRIWESGVYTLQLTDDCSSSADFMTLSILSIPHTDLGEDTVVNIPFSTILEGGEGTSYLWSTGEISKRITVKDTGIYWLQISNACGSTIDSISITDTSTAGISSIGKLPIKLFPNPANDKVNILMPNSKPADIQLFTIDGRLIAQTVGIKESELDLSSLPNGTYLIKVMQENAEGVFRLVISH